ncbi:hypothetical protein LTR82_012868 [Friedmanniomyces endolithicus]|uniref:Uncharacterized protein n=1 Tax=Friedmanniomyces endolithicus TaxID=329885 RepID=A0AAN6FCY9_9PEZI|nr:hypothetical protein LTR82_012868 [Friedmanniomyces endolithicus]
MDCRGPRDGVDQKENFDDLIDFNGGAHDQNKGNQSEGNGGEGNGGEGNGGEGNGGEGNGGKGNGDDSNGDFQFDIDGFNRMTEPMNPQSNTLYSFSPVFHQYGGNNYFNHNTTGSVSNQVGDYTRAEQSATARGDDAPIDGGRCQRKSAMPQASGQSVAAGDGVYDRVKSENGQGEYESEHESKKGKKDRKTAQQKPRSSPPAYVAGITDPDNARWALAHPRSADFTRVRPRNDDLAAVKGRMHFYAKQFYDALQTAGVVDLSGYSSMARASEPGRDNDIANRFQKQQREALEKARDLMIEPQQIKDARANCILAYDAAVFVHETGVPTKDFEDVTDHPERESAHYPHIDLVAICSARLEMMIDLVRDFKPIALDVLEGKHMRDFAQDPVYYAGKKQTFLKSNATRAASNAAVKKGKDNLYTGDGVATSSEANGGGETTAGRRSKKRKVTTSETEADLANE